MQPKPCTLKVGHFISINNLETHLYVRKNKNNNNNYKESFILESAYNGHAVCLLWCSNSKDNSDFIQFLSSGESPADSHCPVMAGQSLALWENCCTLTLDSYVWQ